MRELAALERDNNNHDRMLCETIEDQKRVNPAMEHIAKASGMADFCARARLRYETEEKQDQFAAYARRAQSGDISVYNQWGKKAMEGRMGLPEFGKLGDACPIFYQGALRKDTASTVSLAYYWLRICLNTILSHIKIHSISATSSGRLFLYPRVNA